MKNLPSIAFRTYVMKELACLYFPEERADLASRHFRLLIRQDPLLLSELQKLGFRPLPTTRSSEQGAVLYLLRERNYGSSCSRA